MGGANSGRSKGSRWSRLSGIQQKELKDMRKRQRTENKKKKVLKMDSEGVSIEYCIVNLENVSAVKCTYLTPKNKQ